jgi:hypothetical protein
VTARDADKTASTLQDVLIRVERRYQNEVAERRQAELPYTDEEIARVNSWLASVSFEEWFMLEAECVRLRADLAVATEALEQAGQDVVALGSEGWDSTRHELAKRTLARIDDALTRLGGQDETP